MAAWLFNPVMLWIGAAAILSPIIIHLLNKRRFRIVDWAAMDFLLDADRKNRRRVRLENLILLLLRCLAMFLLGLILARPFLPSQLAGVLGQAREFQRVVLLDDSLSQQAMIGNQPAFDVARDRLKQLLQSLSSNNASDWLTLYLTSQPGDPVIANEPVTGDTINGLIARIDELNCSESVARYDQSLAELGSFLEENRGAANEVVYVLSDLRRRDWADPSSEGAGNSPRQLMTAISDGTPNTFLVDVGAPVESNLVITDISVDDLLVAGTIVRFNVTVRNTGGATAENVQLRLRVDEGQPQTEILAAIPPGESRAATFRYLFQYDPDAFASLDLQEQLESNRINARVFVEISQAGGAPDGLVADSEGYFAARVLKGLPILIVDGDPSPSPERSESYYLRGVGLPGTGLLVDVATVGELETASLGKYRVIFLCNVDEASADRVAVLRQWVADGGGLVFLPGDRVRAETFNDTFWNEGNGLSPLKLIAAEGDVTRANWVYYELRDPQHPAFRVALDEEIGFSQIEIFSWWKSAVAEGQTGSTVAVPLVLTDPDQSPAMAEQVIGKGRTVCFTIPADADWTLWAAHPTYVCVMWDLVNYLTGSDVESARGMVGQGVARLVDLSLHDQDVSLVDPREEKTQARAQPLEASGGGAAENVLYQVQFPPLARRGFWTMELRKKDGESDPVLYAANVDPAEGDLRRLDLAALPDDYFGVNTRVVSHENMILQDESGASNEIWPQLLLALAAVLAVEQLLATWFGRRR